MIRFYSIESFGQLYFFSTSLGLQMRLVDETCTNLSQFFECPIPCICFSNLSAGFCILGDISLLEIAPFLTITPVD